MNFQPTPIQGLWEITTAPRGDARGSLTRLYCADEFEEITPGLRFVQVNHSITAQRGTVRGMHFQRAPALEAKLIRCLRGSVFDVIVDVRENSPTFGRWHAVELTEANQRQVLIPAGCAHGFQSMADDSQLLYQHSAAYAPFCEDGLAFDDPRVDIRWPLPITEVSARDWGFKRTGHGFEGVRI
jgi:dTDP-4-dehydrorhamnose 3,5-epimerase